MQPASFSPGLRRIGLSHFLLAAERRSPPGRPPVIACGSWVGELSCSGLSPLGRTLARLRVGSPRSCAVLPSSSHATRKAKIPGSANTPCRSRSTILVMALRCRGEDCLHAKVQNINFGEPLGEEDIMPAIVAETSAAFTGTAPGERERWIAEMEQSYHTGPCFGEKKIQRADPLRVPSDMTSHVGLCHDKLPQEEG
eukprot:CAMPEP_0180197874 /NCGR_PEP_ID=MMETSP0987-20121128/4862_1 /TAXON_ID=697907 /ORGANISM="non described non described, Strain CCMP2293" /LENGTH=196 /DNA_ID=CAMNT_0022152829 /DNA_START=254 /DNA_END=842 /DNA_ORIENTATION=-